MESLDLISNCANLQHILAFLPNSDVLACMRINKRFYDVVNKNWMKMEKALTELTITKTKFLFENETVPALMVKYRTDSGTRTLKIFNEQIRVSKHVASSEHGLSLFLRALLPRVQITKLNIDCDFNLAKTQRDFTTQQLSSIRDLLRANSEVSPNCLVTFMSATYSHIYSDIMEHFGSAKYTFLLDDTLGNIYNYLILEYNICILNNWETDAMIQILKDWLSGNSNIKHLRIREINDDENPSKWAELCSALQVVPVYDVDYKTSCDEQFELRRQCDIKVLDVKYYKHGCCVKMEQH